MRVKSGGEWIADSEDIVLLHEPGHYPVAYFPFDAVTKCVLEPAKQTSRRLTLARLSGHER